MSTSSRASRERCIPASRTTSSAGCTSTATSSLPDLPPATESTVSYTSEVVYGAMNAIRREKQIKAWTREKRMALIESTNAGWLDLARDWFRETLSPTLILSQARDGGPSLRGSAATEESKRQRRKLVD